MPNQKVVATAGSPTGIPHGSFYLTSACVGQEKTFPSMNTTAFPLCVVIIGLVLPALSLRGEEILLHTGPPVSTPASTPVSPFPNRGESKQIEFQREFFVDRELLASLPGPTSSGFGTVPVSAAEAIQLATKDIDPQGGLRTLIVTELRLLKGPASGNKQVEYYLVSTLANGSEVHRIVLMNRKVISSKLREIKE